MSLNYLFDPTIIINVAGLAGVGIIIFAETGVLLGFFLPGDSLLFTAGLFASQGYFHVSLLLLTGVVAAILGDSVGYALGKKFGPSIFKKRSRWLRDEHIARAKTFYERHGGKTIILARFMPLLRTLVPIFAGVTSMHYGTFLFYNIIGGVLWVAGLGGLGFYFGSVIPNIDRYLLPIIGGVVLLSLMPVFFQIFRNKKNRARVFQFFKEIIFGKPPR